MQLLVAFVAAALAGVVNSMAGGGTLLTFPTLIALGLESKMANATSATGLWAGSLGGAWGYRRELLATGRDAYWFFVPSLLGGTLGALLLLWTGAEDFKRLAPWLILTATVLFMAQGPISRRLQARSLAGAQVDDASRAALPPVRLDSPGLRQAVPSTQYSVSRPSPRRWAVVFGFQFLVGVYGGYFGAGIGILMLAVLGFLGLKDIHQMNGIKNAAALFINGVAVVLFALYGLVHWPFALTMALGALSGGYASASLARWIGPRSVRRVVIAVGLTGAAWTAWRTF